MKFCAYASEQSLCSAAPPDDAFRSEAKRVKRCPIHNARSLRRVQNFLRETIRRHTPARIASGNAQHLRIAPGTERPAPIGLAECRVHRVCSSAMERSQPAPINSVFLNSETEMADEIYLTVYGLMAERHWRDFRPKMVQKLEAKGTLMEALFEAQETTINEMEVLTRQLETEQKLTPQQAHDQAWETIREKYIFLPPEENMS